MATKARTKASFHPKQKKHKPPVATPRPAQGSRGRKKPIPGISKKDAVTLREMVNRLGAGRNGATAIAIKDSMSRTVGYLIATGVTSPTEAEFEAETRHRIENPPERYLTDAELLASLQPQ